LPDEVVQKLVGEAFNRLDPSAQKVMQALAVYNRPVSPAAIDYLLQPHLPSIDSALVLNRLVNIHFARREAGRYHLHPADKEYAFSIIPVEKDLTTKVTKENQEESSRSLRASRLTNAFTQHDLLNRAADYFAQARKPRAEWKKLDDLAAQLAEFELRCEAGGYDTAASVLAEVDSDYLFLWGHYRLVIDLHFLVKDKLQDKSLIITTMYGIGNSYLWIGDAQKAISFYESGLHTAQEEKERGIEGVFLGNLAIAYAALGEPYKAIKFDEQALAVAREIGDEENQANWLIGLGNRYSELGDIQRAIEFYEQGLEYYRKNGHRRNEGSALGNIGSCYADLGDKLKAIEFCEQALVIFREISDRSGESKACEIIGNSFLSFSEYKHAKENFQQAIQIADEISFLTVQLGARSALAETYLFQNDLINAYAAIETALQYNVEKDDYDATALHGIIALRQGERKTAQEAFTKSIAQADEILAKTPEYYSALDAKGLALCGLTICGGRGDPSMPTETNNGKTIPPDKSTVSAGRVAPTVDDAIATFRKARKIAPHAGVVKSVLRLFDELVKCDEEGILKGVREVIAG
ncbi:MAG: tetratricopeptide repeat protein, partial [Chloroflexi bacterium]|nr:tetratricopeptide repeat protein [Chloroflexota bacterium]